MAYKKSPADIERTSMEIIEGELKERGIVLTPDRVPVVRRVIHTTADFDYARTLDFTPEAVPRALDALGRGVPIITDTNMAKAGVSAPGLGKLGGEVLCFMADPDVAARARQEGTTRAVAAVKHASAHWPHAVYAVGNAPTALFQLAEEIERGCRPALVVAVPVGFVNVVEAKEKIWQTCLDYDIPAIVARGRKGGSPVAAAICNALLYAAADMTDPGKRGW